MARTSTTSRVLIGGSKESHGLGRRVALAIVDWSRSIEGRSISYGAVAGLYVVDFGHQLLARFGSGYILLGGAFAAVSAGLLLGAIGAGPRRTRPFWQTLLATLVPAVWALLFGALSDAVGSSFGRLDLDTLSSTRVQWLAAFGLCGVLLTIPVACGARLCLTNIWLRGPWVLTGVGAGSLLAVYLMGPLFGMQSAAWLAIAWSLAAIAARIKQSLSHSVAATNDPSVPLELESPTSRAADRSRSMDVLSSIGALTGSVVVGMMVAATGRLTFQLFPETEAAEWTACCGFLFGTAVGWALGRRRGSSSLVLVGALGSVLPLVAFPLLVELFLSVTSNVSQVSLLMLIRGTLAAGFFFLNGLIWGALAAWRPLPDHSRGATDSATDHGTAILVQSAPALFVGCAAAGWLFAHGPGVAFVLAAGAAVFATVGAALSLPGSSLARRRFASVACLATVCLATLGLSLGTYDPVRAARLLFSTNVFMARHAGTEPRLLPFLDDSRFIAAREGMRGTYTVWKNRAVQFHVRESGIPKGTFDAQPEICPQGSGDILPALLPLVLHEAPRRVLLLGLGTGSMLATCIEFPIEQVTCLEADRGLIDLLGRDCWAEASVDPRTDNRVRIVEVEPAWAVRARRGSFDVVVSDTDQAGVAAGTPYYTREYYAGAATQLAFDGIFAQRFQQIDFGAWPLRSILATMRSVFAEVAAVESGPGDLVLLATNSPQGLARPQLLKRFQSPQAIRTFEHVGWDWSVAINLAAYFGEGCDALVAGAPPVNTASNGLFAYRLPQEMMRWGEKGKELAELLSPHAGRIGLWPNVDGTDSELVRRLADVVKQHDLMTMYPDQPWAYRKAVREDLTKHPHTVIEETDAGLDRRLDTVDRRRLNYFVALGKGTNAARPTLEVLHRIEEFANPYDPVLTYFLHHELSLLYARAETPEPSAQLQHRLYTIYYSDPRDRSIRDIVDGLNLLAHNSQILSPALRWDHMNALMDLLKGRWNNRGLVKPPSAQILLNDLERSVGAVESAFSEMDKIRADVGVAATDWQARRDVLERSLIRPLRSYRTELVPYYMKETERTTSSDPPSSVQPRQNAN